MGSGWGGQDRQDRNTESFHVRTRREFQVNDPNDPALDIPAGQDTPHRLYRFFGEGGVLLYIGITDDLPTRLSSHRREKSWWREWRGITATPYPSRQALEAAEIEAIKAEKPLYNVTHNRPRPTVPSRPARPSHPRRPVRQLIIAHSVPAVAAPALWYERHCHWDGERHGTPHQSDCTHALRCLNATGHCHFTHHMLMTTCRTVHDATREAWQPRVGRSGELYSVACERVDGLALTVDLGTGGLSGLRADERDKMRDLIDLLVQSGRASQGSVDDVVAVTGVPLLHEARAVAAIAVNLSQQYDGAWRASMRALREDLDATASHSPAA